MASTKSPVTTQDEVKAEASAVTQAADTKAKARLDVIASLTFAELFAAIRTAAHWSDVLGAADGVAKAISDGGITEKTVSAQARKVGTLYPSAAAQLRIAAMSYQLSGRRCNPTQQAELASKLPSLRKIGTIKANEITFGGLVLPSVLGEF